MLPYWMLIYGIVGLIYGVLSYLYMGSVKAWYYSLMVATVSPVAFLGASIIGVFIAKILFEHNKMIKKNIQDG